MLCRKALIEVLNGFRTRIRCFGVKDWVILAFMGVGGYTDLFQNLMHSVVG